MPFLALFLICWKPDPPKKKPMTNVHDYFLVLIQYSGYFMYGEMKMFICTFINDSRKCIYAHYAGNVT